WTGLLIRRSWDRAPLGPPRAQRRAKRPPWCGRRPVRALGQPGCLRAALLVGFGRVARGGSVVTLAVRRLLLALPPLLSVVRIVLARLGLGLCSCFRVCLCIRVGVCRARLVVVVDDDVERGRLARLFFERESARAR